MSLPDKKGHFGIFGGKFVPETLMAMLAELERVYAGVKKDRAFQQELRTYLTEYAGRPTRLYLAERLSRHLGKKRAHHRDL